jgi:glycosyltransferase 2 family protein
LPTERVTSWSAGRPSGRFVRSSRWAAVAAVSGAALLGTSVLAQRGVAPWEPAVFNAMHDVPRAFDHALWLPMQLGSAWAPPLAAAVGWRASRSWRPTAGALVAGWGGWWLAKGVKAVVDRGRPEAELAADVVRSSAVTEGLGFVSGHTTVAFACAAVLAPYLSRPWRIVAWTLATVVALSRVVVGAHLPLDVVGGAALGLLLAALWHLAVGAPRMSRG